MTNGTEDDTFNALRRTPTADLHGEYVSRQWEFYEHNDVFIAWLRKHGWKADAFRNAGTAHLKWVKHK